MRQQSLPDYLEGIFGQRLTGEMLDDSPATGIAGCRKALEALPRGLSQWQREQVRERVSALRAIHEATARGEHWPHEFLAALRDLWDLLLETLDNVVDFLRREGGRLMPGERERQIDRYRGGSSRRRDSREWDWRDGRGQRRESFGRERDLVDRIEDGVNRDLGRLHDILLRDNQRRAADIQDNMDNLSQNSRRAFEDLERRVVAIETSVGSIKTEVKAEVEAAVDAKLTSFKNDFETSMQGKLDTQKADIEASVDQKLNTFGTAFEAAITRTVSTQLGNFGNSFDTRFQGLDTKIQGIETALSSNGNRVGKLPDISSFSNGNPKLRTWFKHLVNDHGRKDVHHSDFLVQADSIKAGADWDMQFGATQIRQVVDAYNAVHFPWDI